MIQFININIKFILQSHKENFNSIMHDDVFNLIGLFYKLKM